MLELADYPNPRKYRINNSEFCEFFDAVAQGVMEKGGVVVAGDSEKLLNEAADKLAGLWAKSPLTYLCEWRTIISAKREPYFLEFVRKNKPDLVVLDHRHAEFVANGLKQNVFIID